MKHRSRTEFEDAYYLSVKTGKTLFAINQYDVKRAIKKTDEGVAFLSSAGESIIAIHNHPGSTQPSICDLGVMAQYPKIKKMVVVGHDGAVYIVSDMRKDLTRDMLDNLYELEYDYYSIGRPDNIADELALEALCDMGLFKLTKR